VSTNISQPPSTSAGLEGSGPRVGFRTYPSRAEAISRLEQLRSVVPVFAQEVLSARRQAAFLRAENGWLLEQVRQLQRRVAQNGSRSRGQQEKSGKGNSRNGSSRRQAETPTTAPRGRPALDPPGSPGAQTNLASTESVALTADQLACIEALSDDCTIVGVENGCPLVRQAGGEVALLEGDGRLAPAEPKVRAVTTYLEVRAS
jgi:hypothetical protein